MEESLGKSSKSTGLKRLVIILAALFIGTILYFIIVYRFTPSWLVGQEVTATDKFVEITASDLDKFPNLEKFIKNARRNTGEAASVLIRGSHGQGTRLQDFLNQSDESSLSSFPYVIKFENKFYGLDIIYQFKSPIIL
ncbi:MAG: hypothetical protein Q8R08_04325 [bacterium]|nr:hypothetical protein [bacterium]